MATPKPQTPSQQSVKVSHKPSITGIVLSLVSLTSSAIGNAMVHAKYTPTGPTTGSIEAEAGHAVATGTTSALGAVLGMPFLVGGFFFGGLAVIFILLRLRKVRVAGAVFSLLAVALVVWSVTIAIGGFEYIKADPA